MANVTIPNLTSATTIAPSTDLMVLEQTNGTRKATLSQIFTSSATSGSGLGITSGGVYAIKSGLDSDISDINTLLGSTSIASIGDGTVTGAVSKINSDLTVKYDNITLSTNFSGNVAQVVTDNHTHIIRIQGINTNIALVAGTNYIVGSLPANIVPLQPWSKEILVGNNRFAYLFIGTDGNISIVPRQNMSLPSTISIVEAYIK